MRGNGNSTMRTIGAHHNSSVPMIFGTADSVVTLPAVRANGKIFPIVVGNMTIGVNSDNAYKISSPLKDLSMSEILKLAEDRARVAGICRRSIDNPWHKRMVISDNITRRQASQTTLKNHPEIGLNAVKDESDKNEIFFDNLMKKMTVEQFMPNGKASRLRKRTCLWNKENSSTAKKIKRHKDISINTKSIPSTMEFLARRILPRQIIDNNSTVGARIQLQCEDRQIQQQDQASPQHKSTPYSIQEHINTQAMNLCFTDYDSSTATTTSVNGWFHENQTANCNSADSQKTLKLVHNRSTDRIDCISACSQKTLNNIVKNRSIDRIDYDSIHETLPSSFYTTKKSKNFWDSPCLSTIEECREVSMVVDSLGFDNINTKIDLSPHLTPPFLTKPVDCKACNFHEEEFTDTVNNTSSQLSSLMLLEDSDRKISGILDKYLFT